MLLAFYKSLWSLGNVVLLKERMNEWDLGPHSWTGSRESTENSKMNQI